MSWRNKSVRTRRGLWRLSSAVGVITPDDSGRGNHGTMVNAPTFARTIWGPQCMRFNGINQYVDLGDLTYLNAVSAFTIAFWMNQDVLDILDYLFIALIDADHDLQILTNAAGLFLVHLGNGADNRASFDYSAVISANSWHHIAVVFDGSRTGDANRLVVYVDSTPVTLTIDAVPASTAALLLGTVTGLYAVRLYVISGSTESEFAPVTTHGDPIL